MDAQVTALPDAPVPRQMLYAHEFGCVVNGGYIEQLKEYANLLRQSALAFKERVEALERDAKRLDYLDALNAAKNARIGTTYGWRLSENHNRIALEDHNYPPLSVREAIDSAIAQMEGAT